MASIRLAYLGGGSTRAAGTMAAFIHNHGARFAGSEVVLIDLDADHLDIVRRLAERMTAARGLDLRFTTTTDRRAGLTDVDAVLSSYRPGGFEARRARRAHPAWRTASSARRRRGRAASSWPCAPSTCCRASIGRPRAGGAEGAHLQLHEPRQHRGPGRHEAHATSPSRRSARAPTTSRRSWPTPRAWTAPGSARRMVGLNHTTWSVELRLRRGRRHARHRSRPGQGCRVDRTCTPADRRFVELAVTMGAIPAQYLRYYYFRDEVLAELQARPTTRSEDILAQVPGYWAHYVEQAGQDDPQLDPARSRGGIFELELALDAIDSTYNDLGLVPAGEHAERGRGAARLRRGHRRGGLRPCRPGGRPPGAHAGPPAARPGPHRAARPSTSGSRPRRPGRATRRDAIRALASHPWMTEIRTAEALYDEMATAHREHLPERLLP